jgi:mannose-6-phosphate isomerase-like protein (cupin superfamily)
MRSPHSLGVATLATLLLAGTAQSQSQSQDSVVAGRITTFFHALGAGDSAELRRTVTSDFYLFEHARWSLDTLLHLMPAVHGRHWSQDQVQVTVAKPLAYVTYVNHSDGAPIYWLESAVLRETHGTWRIAFMHSTRMPLPADTLGLGDWRPMGNGGYIMRLVGSTPPSPTELTAFRVRYPANFKADSGVHYHLGTEHVVMLKGTLMVGFGDTADYSKMKAYGPGSFLVIPAGTHHYETMRGEVESQVEAVGPMTTIWLTHAGP